MKSKEYSTDLHYQNIYLGNYIKHISKSLNFPMSKWTDCETTNCETTNAGIPAKLSKQAGRSLVRQATMNPMATELQKFSTEMGKPARRTNMSKIFRGLCYRVAWQKAYIWQAHKDSESMMKRRCLVSGDKLKLFGLNSKWYVWQKPYTAHQSESVSESLYFTKHVTHTRNLSW